ncbi:MAG: PepSY domain-containing protein [Pseudomonadota bacterium]
MTIKSIWLRRIHKWVGLVIGLQFLVWAISGTAMALLDMEQVTGGASGETAALPLPVGGAAWPKIQLALDGNRVSEVAYQALPQGQTLLVTTAQGVRLFSAVNGQPVTIDRRAAVVIARAAHPSGAAVSTVRPLRQLNLAVRAHSLPIWQVDFRDEANSSYYVSGTTGKVIERRNDTWRWWDFFWMLHNMDYSERASFNHPLIITAGIAMAWLAATGFWLLFRTMWRHDLGSIKKVLRTRNAA